VLSNRPIYDWINRVNQGLRDLVSLNLDQQARATLDYWIETEFVVSLLRLQGIAADRPQVDRLVRAGVEPPDHSARRDLTAFRRVKSLAQRAAQDRQLSPEMLRELHSVRDLKGEFLRPQSVETACDWFGAASFGELHPVEQAGIALLRLIEIEPFEERSEETAVIASSLFPLRSGLPPVIIPADRLGDYRSAVKEGLRMSTRPIVELLADCMALSLTGMKQLLAR
jgi:hypothetical protein